MRNINHITNLSKKATVWFMLLVTLSTSAISTLSSLPAHAADASYGAPQCNWTDLTHIQCQNVTNGNADKGSSGGNNNNNNSSSSSQGQTETFTSQGATGNDVIMKYDPTAGQTNNQQNNNQNQQQAGCGGDANKTDYLDIRNYQYAIYAALVTFDAKNNCNQTNNGITLTNTWNDVEVCINGSPNGQQQQGCQCTSGGSQQQQSQNQQQQNPGQNQQQNPQQNQSQGKTCDFSNWDQRECPISDQDGLRFVICPVILIGEGALNLLSTFLENFLYTPVDQIFSNQLQQTFAAFRDLGIGLLVIAGLVMVIAQAADIELISAYTIKKALPRIVIAAIGMVLVWPLLQLVVVMFNDLGQVMQALILDAAKVPGVGTHGVWANNASKFFSFLALGGVLAFSVMLLILVLAFALLALLVGFIVLAIRQLVILICIITAPLAIASAVLPGTEKLWQFWRSTFLGAMMMYPIIMGLLGAGIALSSIAGANATGKSGLDAAEWDLFSMVLYFSPLFALPWAFKMSNGIMGQVTSLVSGFAPFARVTGAMGSTLQRRAESAKSGEFWRSNRIPSWMPGRQFMVGQNGLIEKANQRIMRTTTGGGLNRMRRQAKFTGAVFDTASEFGDKNTDFAQYKTRADVLKASMHEWSKKGLYEALKNGKYNLNAQGEPVGMDDASAEAYTGMIMNARDKISAQGYMAASVMAQAGNGPGYADFNDMAEHVGMAIGGPTGDRVLGNRLYAASMRQAAARAGRPDLANPPMGEALGNLNSAIDKMNTQYQYQEKDADGNAVLDKQGQPIWKTATGLSQEERGKLQHTAFRFTDANSLSRAHPTGVRQIMQGVDFQANQLRAAHDVAGLQQLSSDVGKISQRAAQIGAPANRVEIMNRTSQRVQQVAKQFDNINYMGRNTPDYPGPKPPGQQ